MQDMNKTERTAYRKSVKLAQCALFVVLMIVSAFIRIPVPYVPVTFQTVVAVLAGLMLGPWWGAASVAVYVILGLLGLPVFANGGGGYAYVVQLTFGYIIGFIAAALVAGLLRGNGAWTFRRAAAAALAGMLANYAIGVPYFALIWRYYLNYASVWEAVFVNNMLYLPKDVVLCVLAALLAERLWKALKR